MNQQQDKTYKPSPYGLSIAICSIIYYIYAAIYRTNWFVSTKTDILSGVFGILNRILIILLYCIIVFFSLLRFIKSIYVNRTSRILFNVCAFAISLLLCFDEEIIHTRIGVLISLSYLVTPIDSFVAPYLLPYYKVKIMTNDNIEGQQPPPPYKEKNEIKIAL